MPSRAQQLTSHALADDDDAADASDCWCWETFWLQEAHRNTRVLAMRRTQLAQISQQLSALKHRNCALALSNSTLGQDISQQQRQLDQEQQSMCSSVRLPPRSSCSSSRCELTAQLVALQDQQSSNQATLAGLRHELSVLEAIPPGSVGRVVAGDTALDDLQASQQQLAVELQAVFQDAEQDLQAMEELQAEVSRLQSKGTSQEREGRLAAQLQDAQELTQALQHKLGGSSGNSSSSSSLGLYDRGDGDC